jgi:hypothetical protein
MAFNEYTKKQIKSLIDELEHDEVFDFRDVSNSINQTPSILVSHEGKELEVFVPDGVEVHHFVVMDDTDQQVCFTMVDDVMMFLWSQFLDKGCGYDQLRPIKQSTCHLDHVQVGEHLIPYIVNGDVGDLSSVNMMDADDYLQTIANQVRDNVIPYYEPYKLDGMTFEVDDESSLMKCNISGMWTQCHNVRVVGIISQIAK